VTHFVGCIKSPNAPNFSCNYKKIGSTSKARLIKCLSFVDEGKTQVRWVTKVGWREHKDELI